MVPRELSVSVVNLIVIFKYHMQKDDAGIRFCFFVPPR